MKRKLTTLGALCLGALMMFGCEQEDDALDMKLSSSQNAISECYTIDFENFTASDFPITQVSGAYGTVGVMAMKREEGNTSDVYSSTNVARIYDTQNHTGDDGHDLGVPDQLGKILIANQYTPAEVAANAGNPAITGPNDNAWGATLELDFSSIGYPVTLKSLDVVDIDNNHVVENQSYVQVIDGNGAMHNFPLAMFVAEGSVQTINTNVANAKKLIVVLDGENTSVGSGAIDNIMFCVEKPDEPMGCTKTQGYWKTHAPNSKNYNKNTKVDPAWGSLYDDMFFSSGKTYMQVLDTPTKGDAYYILAHQYIATMLNVASGASIPTEVKSAYDMATTYFNGGSSPSRNMLIEWAGILADYNEGKTGPGHCD